VTIEYHGDRPVRLDTVVVSTQHAGDIDLDAMLTPDIEEHVIRPVVGGLSPSTRRATAPWSTPPAASRSAARWATPA
jgi:S-adenosylmethionine synthetase